MVSGLTCKQELRGNIPHLKDIGAFTFCYKRVARDVVLATAYVPRARAGRGRPPALLAAYVGRVRQSTAFCRKEKHDAEPQAARNLRDAFLGVRACRLRRRGRIRRREQPPERGGAEQALRRRLYR